MTIGKTQFVERIVRRFRRSPLLSSFEKQCKQHLVAPLLRNVLHPSAIEHSQSFLGLRLLLDMQKPPLISVLIPVFKPDIRLFEKAVSSVQQQWYQNWELCLVDDGSNNERVRFLLEKLGTQKGIKILHSPINEGISSTINKAAALATGSYLGVLDQDDELHPAALFEYACIIARNSNADIIYCDENKIDERGTFCSPWYKSDWNPDLSLSFNYVMHFVLYRSRLFHDLGGARPRFDGSQDYDLLLRAAEKTSHILHIPKILYHWRISKGSIAGGPEAKPYVFETGLASLNDALRRRGIEGTAHDAPHAWKGVYHVQRKIRRAYKTSILILLTGSRIEPSPLLKSIAAFTPNTGVEIICMDLSSTHSDRATLPLDLPYSYIATPENASGWIPACFNAMARKARGDFLLFLDDTIEILSSDTLSALHEHGQRPEVGAVGAKLLYANGLVEHTGIILGPFGLLGYANKATPDDEGYVGIKRMITNYSAIMGLGMLTSRLRFLEYGGFDEQYQRHCWDADYCLRLRNRHFLITSTPYAVFRHHIDISPTLRMISDHDAAVFKKRWHYLIDNDPYFNKNLSRSREDFWPG